MDPLSALLAAITLATAVKDMVELADKIRESFDKVSDNLRNARILANDTGHMIYELRDFCEQYYEILDDDKELKRALLQLIEKLTQFHSNTVPLIPSPNPRFRERVNAWKNNRIEASIQELKADVKKCRGDFVMMGVARILVTSKEMHKSTNENLRRIQQQVSHILLTNNSTASFLSHVWSSSHQKSIEASNQNIVAFVQTAASASTSLLKTPSASKEQKISAGDMYLKEQIYGISKSLSGITTLKATHYREPLEEYASPFAPLVITSLRPEYCNPDSLHRDVVEQSLQIRKTLETQPTSISIQKGAWSLVDLSIGLHYLGMADEAATMGKWAVELFGALAAVDSATYSPFLAHSLKHLTCFYTQLDDGDAAFSTIQEAVNVSQSLQNANTPLNLRVQYSSILTICSKHVTPKDHNRGVELASESLERMEEIIDIKSLPVPYSKDPSGVVQVNRNFLDELYRLAPSDHAIVEYARALRELSDCLVYNDQLGRSLDLKVLALAIFYDLPARISRSMNEELEGILYDVITQPTKHLLPSEDLLHYTEDYINIMRKRVETNSPVHGRTLCDALWEKAGLLTQLGRHDDAIIIWKEVADLAQSHIQDQLYYANALSQLSWSFRNTKRHEEAADSRKQSLIASHDISNIVSRSWQAHSYYDLCVDLQLAKRYDEAVNAARNALNQSQKLTMDEEDPHIWRIQIGRGQTALATSFLHAGDHTSAMDAGAEALQVFAQLVSTDSSCVSYYLYALRANLEIAMTVDDASASVKRFKDVIQRYQQLSAIFPEDVGFSLLEAEIDYGNNLDRLDRLTEARQLFEGLLARWNSEDHSEVQTMHLHISAHISYASILDNQGYTELSLQQIIKAIQIGENFCSTHPDIAGQTVGAMHRHAQLLVALGKYPEALAMAEKTLKFSRTIQIDDLSAIVGTMHVVAIAAEHIHNFERVIQISQEAVNICREEDMAEYFQINTAALILLPRSLQFLSSGEAAQNSVEGWKHALDAVVEAEKLKSNTVMASADAERSYMDTRGHLGRVFFAHGKILKAREIFEEQRVYLKNRVKERSGEYPDLVAILYRLGIMYCHDGSHSEGASMARELTTVMSRLEIALPGLCKLVKIAMRHEVSMPTLRKLQVFRTDLTCNHHSHISFD